MSRTPANRSAQGRRTGKLTGTVRLGHSHRYCQVRLLIRYRQYPTFPTESRVLVIRIDGAQNSTNWDGKIKATVSLRAVEGRKCLSAHCFGWHCNGTVQTAPVLRATGSAGLRP